MLDNIRGIGELALRGMVANKAPDLFKGMLNAWLTDFFISPQMLSDMVMNNQSLWPLIPENYHVQFQRMASKISDLDWLTTEWVIDAVRKEHPSIASLFLGWKKGRNWMDRQIIQIKEEAGM